MAGKRVTGRGRTPREAAKLAERRAEVFRRYRAGETMAAIGSSMVPKMSHQLVSLDIQLAVKELRESHRGSLMESIEFELEQIGYAQAEMREAWEHSKRLNKGVGDHNYLEGYAKMSDRRRKLLGLDRPVKIETQTTTEVSPNFKTIEQMMAEVEDHEKQLKARREEMDESP